MGKMIFIAERGKVTDFFQPRKRAENLIDRFGVWLTSQGAVLFANFAYVILVACGILKLVSWVIQRFHEGIFRGVLSIVGACFVGMLGFNVLFIVWLLAYIVVWALGWACNKWTLAGMLVVLISLNIVFSLRWQ